MKICPKTNKEEKCTGCEHLLTRNRCALKIAQGIRGFYQTERGREHKEKMRNGMKKFWSEISALRFKKEGV